MPDVAEVPLLIAFTDFSRYAAHVERFDDLEVASVMQGWYELAESAIGAGSGRVVKFIGDATLAVFPSEDADTGVRALLALKAEADRYMAEHGWDCRLVVKAHHGTVAAGEFGRSRRYDVLGKAVNTTARLQATGVALSAEAFRALAPATRQFFKKHTPPITYIRQEDPHR